MQAILASLLWRRSSTRQVTYFTSWDTQITHGCTSCNSSWKDQLLNTHWTMEITILMDTRESWLNLKCLVIYHNNLSGSIPSKSSLSFLRLIYRYAQHRGVFDQSYNRLSGTIPDDHRWKKGGHLFKSSNRRDREELAVQIIPPQQGRTKESSEGRGVKTQGIVDLFLLPYNLPQSRTKTKKEDSFSMKLAWHEGWNRRF